VDDHSVDNTTEVVSALIDMYPQLHLKLVYNKGKGACKARNLGMDIAKGEFIKFLDSDDAIYDGSVLEKQVQMAQYTMKDVVFGDEYYFDNNFDSQSLQRIRITDMTNVNQEFFLKRPITSNFLFRNREQKKLRWNERLESGQELFFLFECYFEGYSFYYFKHASVKIRNHTSIDRISNQPTDIYQQQTLYLSQEIERRLKQRQSTHIHFLSSFYVWKLFRGFIARRQGNYGIAQEFLRNMPKISKLAIYSRHIKLLYALNLLHQDISYYCYRLLNNRLIKTKPN